MSKIDYLVICSLVLTITTLSLGHLSDIDEIRKKTIQIENDNGAASRHDAIDQNTEESLEEQIMEKLPSDMGEAMTC